MVRGLSKYAAGRKWPDLSRDAIFRHYRFHVPDDLKAAHKLEILQPSDAVRNLREAEFQDELHSLTQEESIGLLSHLQRIRASLYLLFDEAVKHGDSYSAARLSGQLHANLRLAAEKTGELERHSQQTINNLQISPDYLGLRSALITALRPYPDAGRAVADVFREIENSSTQPPTGQTSVEYRDVGAAQSESSAGVVAVHRGRPRKIGDASKGADLDFELGLK
jgi:hypothetical protein